MGRYGLGYSFAKVKRSKYRIICPCCENIFTHVSMRRVYCDVCDKPHRQLLKGGRCAKVEDSKVVRSSGK